MEYEPKDDPMGADDTGASDMSRISELVSAIQAQLDELRSLVPGSDEKPTEDVVGEADAEQALDEDKADAATPDGSAMPKELLMRAMRGV